ncbi:hypothetical protein LTR62_004684 [Meristemomyces frigidus]|uniref:Fe2OG dioxygenase domain-containing protein n=1 Tax=Meristemomyces frigidus TaxID=1508187 RepID=A0AAN7TDK1_9PEZI|nr:hypothetical protein LTR62_004684 [Meristemomyces frigidus]
MAPSATLPGLEPEYVEFHAGKGKLKRAVLKGDHKKATFASIPAVDFAQMWSDSLNDRKEVALHVGKAFREVGFLYAVNHGISEDIQARTFAVTKEFFELPLEEKMKIHLNKSPAIKGYEALLETRLDDTTRGDNKEAINFSDDPYDPDHGCPPDFDKSYYPPGPGPINQWPQKPSNFRSIMNEYRTAMSDFARRLVRIIALSLDLDETYFDYMLEFPMAGLRPLHYPPQEASTDVGIGAHNDYSWFTCVWQMTPTPALEVLNSNAEWISAPPIPNTLVVNIGDFLERATNDVFVSTVHRVVNKTGDERYSLAYFFTPSHNVMLETVPTCWSFDRPKRYEDVNAGKWQRERLYRARYKHPASIAAKQAGEI